MAIGTNMLEGRQMGHDTENSIKKCFFLLAVLQKRARGKKGKTHSRRQWAFLLMKRL